MAQVMMLLKETVGRVAFNIHAPGCPGRYVEFAPGEAVALSEMEAEFVEKMAPERFQRVCQPEAEPKSPTAEPAAASSSEERAAPGPVSKKKVIRQKKTADKV